METWNVQDWSEFFARMSGKNLPPMTADEIKEAITFLRNRNYPKPADCPEDKCPKYRPACQMGVCNVAVGLCGDF